MDHKSRTEWGELASAVSIARASGNDFYARRIVQRVRAREITIDYAVHLLQTDMLRARNLRNKAWA